MDKTQLKSFKDLSVWQKAVDLAVLTYSITDQFPKSELYGITNQMRRSAVSISSNIAEGFKRNHKKEKLQFYNIAYGSVAELESQIEVSRKLNFLHDDDYWKLNTSITEIGKMIDGLIKSQSKPPESYILNSIFFLIFLSSIFYILNPYPIQAAELELSSQTQIGIGQQFKVDLTLNADEGINALGGKIVFPVDLLELKEIRDGNSIVSLWIEKPKSYILNPKSYISFSGVIPGGYNSRGGLIFSLIFRAKLKGVGSVDIREAQTFLNDGQGTLAKLTTKNLEFRIQDLEEKSLNSKSYILNSKKDTEPPEAFTPQLARDPDIFDNKWFLVFATQDKNSGLDFYEVNEARRFRFWELGFWKKQPETSWQKAESPYLLADQNLKSDIYIKAVDKAGNEMIVILPAKPWYREWLVDIIIGLVLLAVLYLTVRWLRRLLSKKH